MRKDASSAIPHPVSKGMPTPLDFTAFYPLGNRTGKKRLLPQATPLEKGPANRKKVIFCLDMSLWEGKKARKNIVHRFKGSTLSRVQMNCLRTSGLRAQY